MRTVVGARFMKAGRMYFFDPGAVSDYRVNDWIIVRTELGVDARIGSSTARRSRSSTRSIPRGVAPPTLTSQS